MVDDSQWWLIVTSGCGAGARGTKVNRGDTSCVLPSSPSHVAKVGIRKKGIPSPARIVYNYTELTKERILILELVQIIHPLFYCEWVGILIFLWVLPGLDSLRHLPSYLFRGKESLYYLLKEKRASYRDWLQQLLYYSWGSWKQGTLYCGLPVL